LLVNLMVSEASKSPSSQQGTSMFLRVRNVTE